MLTRRQFRAFLKVIAVGFFTLILIPFAVQTVGEIRAFLHSPFSTAPTSPSTGPFPSDGDWLNPYSELNALQPGVPEISPRWLLANLHTHSSRFEGELAPEALAALYREKGFEVLAISDHQWITRIETPPPGLLLLASYEHGANFSKVHFGVLEPRTYFWDWLPLRQTVRQLRWITDRLSESAGFLVVNHPSCRYPEPFSAETLAALPAVVAMELISHWACGDPAFGNAALWDGLWKRGRRVWALGGDDSHSAGTVGAAGTYILAVPERGAVLAALRKGAMVAVGSPLRGPRVLPHSVDRVPGGWRIRLSASVDSMMVWSEGEVIARSGSAGEILIRSEALRDRSYFRLEYTVQGAQYYLNPISRTTP